MSSKSRNSKLVEFYCAEEISSHQHQICYVSTELLVARKCPIDTLFAIEYKKNKFIICSMIPFYKETRDNCFEGILSCNVISGILNSEDFVFEKNIKLSLDKLTPLTIRPISSLKVIIVMKTLENVLNSKIYPKALHEDCRRLLSMYNYTQNSVIKCTSNPLAKLIGVSYIIVKEVGFSDGTNGSEFCVCKMSKETQLEMEIESLANCKSMKKRTPLAGVDHILKRLSRIVLYPWENREKFRQENISIPKGVLLVGPPGCGKSSLVKKLSEETGAALVATSGAEITNTSEDQTIRNFIKVVDNACRLSKFGPCLLFVDEIDSLCPLRTDESSFFDIQLSSQVITALKKCREFPYLVVMGATNRPFALDPAVQTPGCLALEVLLNVPTEEERKAIFRFYLKDFLPSDHPIISELARITPGYVGADIEKFCGELLQKSPSFSDTDLHQNIADISSRFASSTRKALDFITSKPTSTPVGGLDEVKGQLRTIFFHHSKFPLLYKKFKIKPPKGILLFGPRGCGKTRLISELASEKGCTFISADASHLLCPYVGDTEKRIAALFHAARISQPSVVLIDEIDGIFGSREGQSGGVRTSLLTELLQAMDGAETKTTSLQGASFIRNKTGHIEDSILVCGATNNPHLLDPALLRPGRFDKLIYVPPPDQKARLDILKLKSSKLKFDNPNTLEEIAKKTEGWTGAELENLITMAAVKSLLICTDEADEIQIRHSEIFSLLGKCSPSVSPEEISKYEQFRQNVESS